MIPEGLKYTKEHEWIKVDGKKAVIGITDHAQSELGDITFIELPKIGKDVKTAESIATVESVKAASDIYAPVSGKITGINETLTDAPEQVNHSPYDKGWICVIEMPDISGMGTLMDKEAYEAYVEGKA
ncbi:MAG: glycine cleavage system protein GcvH [Candidatus Omnitrophota bacterium]